MKIEVWSDYVCPFCYIGKRHLEQALESTGLGDKTEVIFKAFQLDPNTSTTSDISMHEGLAKKYGMHLEEAKKMTDNVALQAKSVGLNYDFENMKVANTFNAHRLTKLAEAEGVSAKVAERLLHGYFVEAESIGTDNVLVQIAEEAGIDRKRTETMLATDEFADDVKNDIVQAGQIGVKGVPFFVINGKYAISGAQPTEAFAEALKKVAEEEGIQPKLTVLGEEGKGLCTDDNCDI